LKLFLIQGKSNRSPLGISTFYLPDAFCHLSSLGLNKYNTSFPRPPWFSYFPHQSLCPTPRLGSNLTATCAHTEHFLFNHFFVCLFEPLLLWSVRACISRIESCCSNALQGV
jgi:hypothetical protein